MTRRAPTRSRTRAFALALATTAAGTLGCKADPPAPTALSGGSCSDCHGGAENPAPPRATSGATATTELAVGAHQAHVQPGALGAAVACAECHVMPTGLEDPGHLDAAPAEITWGPLASSAAAEPVWSRAEATCAGTYCHGATLTGGVAVTPSWTEPTGPLGCDGCHGAPPPAPHPEDGDCGTCHPGVMVQNGALAIDLGAGTHLDGSVELVGELCVRCHGGPENAAPPRSLEGTTATSGVAVGAHQAHVRQGPLALAFPCQECHVVPTTLDEPTHQDASPAEVIWGVTATGPGLAPTWDREAATCSDVYCHGATLAGGLVATPTWTVVDGSQAFCGACHGLPPPPPHPASSDCKACHQATMDPAGGLDVAGGFHVNGVTDFVPASACNACHGGETNAAPPSATTGESDPTFVGVGAHQAHVAGGSLRGPIPCQECHVVPSSVGEATHMDGLPAEVVWGVLPLADDASPAWDRPSATCSAVYCHGSTLGGGSLTAPVWTEVGTGQAACGTCHGLPPPSPHPPRSECWKCHADTVDDTGQVLVGGGKHVNGVVDVGDLGCSSCHGGEENAAPPVSTTGSSDPNDVAVGAHQAHVRETFLHAAYACSECHVVPSDPKDGAHMDASPAEITFGGPIGTAFGAVPSWDPVTRTCAGTHCHGATVSGGATVTPDWAGGSASCGSCHDFPPALPHVNDPICVTCHPLPGDVLPSTHVNGVVELLP